MVFLARCRGILDELTQAEIGETSWAILNWSCVSKNVAIGFLNYLYSGIWDVEFNSSDEWKQAKSIGLKYGLNLWCSYVDSLKDCFDQPNL